MDVFLAVLYSVWVVYDVLKFISVIKKWSSPVHFLFIRTRVVFSLWSRDSVLIIGYIFCVVRVSIVHIIPITTRSPAISSSHLGMVDVPLFH